MCIACDQFNPFGVGGNWLHENGAENALTITETFDAAGGTSTAYTMSAGDTFTGNLGLASDWDWIGISLTAGETYTITMTAGTMLDPYLWLLNSSGIAVQTNDDGPGLGLNSQITFTPITSGTYYIAADSYYHQPGVAGDDPGSYAVTVTTGGTPPGGGNPLDAITWGYTAPSTINVYFVPGGVTFDDPFGSPQTTSSWSASEQAQAMLAFEQFENVANVTFNVVTNPNQADFMMVESTDPASSLGYWGVGGASVTINGISFNNLDGHGVFYGGGQGWDTGGLQQGGFGFITLIHEIGHGMGLAHPHDTGGSSTVMNGVSSAFGDLGDFNLNQGIYTTMTYNDGWQTAPHGTSPSSDYGYQGTPMAFDIAILQSLYGANTSYNTGNDFYQLPSSNGPGTFYSSIWDAGGNDAILHQGSQGAVIDLRPAPLTYSENGGGYVSYASGIHGGYTIANGAVIENALGGSGDDTIIGNDVANILVGDAGNDALSGGGDNDIMAGAANNDILSGDAGNDTMLGGAGNDALAGGADDDVISGGTGVDVATGGAGADIFAYTLGDGALTMTDFEDGVDDLAIIGASGATFANIAPLLTQDGADVVIGGGATEIRWQNTLVADLGADDFIFV